jgi:hypothetical protein
MRVRCWLALHAAGASCGLIVAAVWSDLVRMCRALYCTVVQSAVTHIHECAKRCHSYIRGVPQANAETAGCSCVHRITCSAIGMQCERI